MRRLVVEGADDFYSVVNLMARHGLDWDLPDPIAPYVSSSNGIDELLEVAPVAAKAQYERLGFVLDADLEPLNRWAQIRDRLQRAGVVLPDHPNAAGTIVAGVRPASFVGVWVMPDNGMPGRLEDFLHRLVPEADNCWALAEKVVKQARQSDCNITDALKSTIHTWLAWQEVPGLPFGTALRANIFRHDSADALAFVAWFRRLYQ